MRFHESGNWMQHVRFGIPRTCGGRNGVKWCTRQVASGVVHGNCPWLAASRGKPLLSVQRWSVPIYKFFSQDSLSIFEKRKMLNVRCISGGKKEIERKKKIECKWLVREVKCMNIKLFKKDTYSATLFTKLIRDFF